MECELCGSKNANRKTKIDGAIVDVCEKCVSFGEEVDPPQPVVVSRKPREIEEFPDVLKPDFKDIIRTAREKKGLKQEDLAKRLNEKASLIKRAEEGWRPSPKLISKLEKFFNISLREDVVDAVSRKKEKKEELTIGDVVEIR